MIAHILAYFGYYKGSNLSWKNLEHWANWILSYELTEEYADYLISIIKSRVRVGRYKT